MEPTAQKPSVPAAATKTAAAAAGSKTGPPSAPTGSAPRSRGPIVVMSFVGVLLGIGMVVMLYYAPPAPQFDKGSPSKAVSAKPGAAASQVPQDGADGEPASEAPVKTAEAARPTGTSAAPAMPGPTGPTNAAALREPAAPKWTGGLQNSWSKHPSAAYELTAENQVALLAKRVRPVLTVRCEAGRTEVFVLTESAAVIEGDDGKHTVRVGFDGGADVTQRWLASADYDALFSPDPVRLAQQIAGSRSMRFGFAPYGAAPVVAQFDVEGFETLLGTIAKTCRWH